MSRTRVPGDGPKCWCGAEAVWSGYCAAHCGELGNWSKRPPVDRPRQTKGSSSPPGAPGADVDSAAATSQEAGHVWKAPDSPGGGAGSPRPIVPERDLVVRATGSISDEMTLCVGISRCGGVTDGVGMHLGKEDRFGSWVIAFADLERWYLANKAMREAHPELKR